LEGPELGTKKKETPFRKKKENGRGRKKGN
jgi:hypothetical protein